MADTALLLEVIAGPDPLDPRQRHPIPTVPYTQALNGNANGLTIGIVKEGFGWLETTQDSDAAVREAARSFEKLGAKVKEVSIPMHRDGQNIFVPILLDGLFQLVVHGNGVGYGWKGYHDTRARDFFGRSRKTMAHSFSHLYKFIILGGYYMSEWYNGHYYSKAQNQTRTLTAAYDEVLKECDLLAMPTVAPQGIALPIDENPPPDEYVRNAWGYHLNTCPSNLTGHPSVSVPCAKINGLPVGLMLTGRLWEDATVLRAAHAFEQTGRYK